MSDSKSGYGLFKVNAEKNKEYWTGKDFGNEIYIWNTCMEAFKALQELGLQQSGVFVVQLGII